MKGNFFLLLPSLPSSISPQFVNMTINHYYKMQELTYKQEEEIATLLQKTLGLLVKNYKYDQSTMPLMNNTYSLWRKLVYSQLTTTSAYQRCPQAAQHLFYLLSDCHYLRNWLNDLLKANSLASAQQSGETEELEVAWARAIWEHSLWCELLLDIVNYPYLQSVFPQSRTYRLTPKVAAIGWSDKTEGKEQILEEVGANIVKKGVGSLAEKIFTRTFLLQASSIAIRLNPIALAASFAFSELLAVYRKDKKNQQAAADLKNALSKCKDSAAELSGIFEQCIGEIGRVLRGAESQQLKRVLGKAVEQDWLEITTHKDEEGWEVVILSGEPNHDLNYKT